MLRNVRCIMFFVCGILFAKDMYCMRCSLEKGTDTTRFISAALRKLEPYAAEGFRTKNEEFDNTGDFVLALLKGARDGDALGVRGVLVYARYVGWWVPYVEIHEHHGVIGVTIRNAFKKIMLPVADRAELGAYEAADALLSHQQDFNLRIKNIGFINLF